MIRQKLEALPFTAHSPEAKQEFFRQAIKYTLNITKAKTLSQAARAVGVFQEVKNLRQVFLKGSPYTLSKYWKAVLAATGENRCGNCINYQACAVNGFVNPKTCSNFSADLVTIADKHGVTTDDLILAKTYLTPEDVELFHQKYAKRVSKKQHFSFEEVCEDLYAWANRFVLKQFAVILKHYRDIESSDLVNELIIQGYFRALECDSIQSKEHFINAVKQRMRQRAITLMSYFTAAERSRVAKDEIDERKQIEYLAKFYGCEHLSWEEKQAKYTPQVDTQYRQQHFSVDFRLLDDENEETTLTITAMHHYQLNPVQEDEVYEAEFLARLIKDLPDDNFRRMIKILMGYYDADYFAHIKNASMTDRQKFKSLLSYFNLSQEAFYSGIAPALIKNGVTSEKDFALLGKLA